MQCSLFSYDLNSNVPSASFKTDEIDIKILGLLLIGKNNKEISTEIGIPLSTIQRRVRRLIFSGIIETQTRLNYKILGYRSGLLHIYLKNGDAQGISQIILKIKNVTSVEIHVGNSDILGHIIYKESEDLLNIISQIKKMESVERVLWSERVYQSPPKNLELDIPKNNMNISE